jgi:hypothetical protein
MKQYHQSSGPADLAVPFIGRHKIGTTILCFALVFALNAVASIANAGPVLSVGQMTFADSDTVIIADWRAGEIHALHLPPVGGVIAKPFNLMNVSQPIAHALHTHPENLRFEDMAFRPGTELAYITISVDRGGSVPRWCQSMPMGRSPLLI